MNNEFIKEYAAIEASLQRFVVSQVPNLSDAEDLVQEVASVLWRKFSDYDPEKAQFNTWAFGVAKFAILNHRRSFMRNKLIFDEELMDKVASYSQITNEADNLKKDALKECLKDMSENKREILVLHYFKKQSCDIIAKKVSRKVSAIYTELHRLRHVLRACIDKKVNG